MMGEKISHFTELPSVKSVVKRWFPETYNCLVLMMDGCSAEKRIFCITPVFYDIMVAEEFRFR